MARVATVMVGLLCCGLPAAAQFVAPGGVIPVVAHLPGLEDTFWQSDVFVLNPGPEAASVMLQLYPEIVDGEPAFEPKTSGPITLPPGSQRTFADVVRNQFQEPDYVKGALWVYSAGGAPLVIASRTYTDNPSGNGTYGQDVNGVLVSGSAWAAGLEHDGFYRTNIGIFWPWDDTVSFEVEVYAAAGTSVGSGTLTFDQAGLQQVSLSRFGVSLLTDGFAVITCGDNINPWYAYASRIDQITGDAVYRVARGYQIAR